jgi:hypothetical protein
VRLQARPRGVVAEQAARVLERQLADLAVDSRRSIATGCEVEPRAATTDAIVTSSSAIPATWASTGPSHVASPRRALRPPEPEAGVAPGISLLVELGGIAVGDRLGQAAAVLLVTGASEISSSQSWGPS